MTMMTWLADALRKGGCNVVELDGWKTRGRGEMGTVKGILLHHSAGSKKGNTPSLNLVLNGRADLPGPLSQLLLARDGTYHVLAAGRCNHAGTGLWQGVTAGNSSFIGIEAENAGEGTDPWPDVQIEAYEAGVAALLNHIGADSVMAAGHKEYAQPKGRKVDPSFDMVTFRENVEQRMVGGRALLTVPPVAPYRAMLRKGSQGNDVYVLQTALRIIADGAFGPATEAAVKAFQQKHELVADGMVGPATWKALGF